MSSEDLMIANTEKSMCLAGVFGGEESGTVESTTTVFLESAYFNPVSIRKSSKRHGLKTDASFRYERGADPMIVDWAGRRAANLICELAGGHVVGKVQKVVSEKFEKKTVELDYDRIESFIGKKIGHDTIEKILQYLAYEFIEKRPGGAVVAVPSYMVDVYRECDVVEEILRIYGYNNIELPSGAGAGAGTQCHIGVPGVQRICGDDEQFPDQIGILFRAEDIPGGELCQDTESFELGSQCDEADPPSERT